MIGHTALQKPSVLLTVGVFGGGGGAPTPPVVSDADYQAVINYGFAQGYTLPSASVRTAQDNLVIAMKAAGIWTLLDVFYNFYTDGDLNFAYLNWKAPASFQCTVMGNAPVLTSMQGILFDGLGNLNTGWIPSNGVNFTQNSASAFIVVLNTLQANTVGDFGCSTNADGVSNGIFLNSATATGTGNSRVNSNTTLVSASGRTEGFWYVRRSASNANSILKNGVSHGADVVVSTARPTVSMYIGASNGNGTPIYRVARRYGMFAAGSSAVSITTFNTTWGAYANPYRAAQAYQAILDYATAQTLTAPTSATQTLQLALIRSLMDNGIWDYLDCFYVAAMDGGSLGFSYINWKAPGTFQCTASVPPTLTNKVGWAFNGTTQYIDTNWRPNLTQAYLQNESGFGLYVATNVQGNLFDCGCSGNADGFTLSSSINTRNASDQVSARTNGTTALVIANASSIGFYHSRRTGANDVALFKNGISIGSSAANASGSRTIYDMFIGASNGINTPILFSSRTIGMFWAGASMISREANFNTAWNTYFTGVSAL